MNKLLLFGVNEYAERALHELRRDAKLEIAGVVGIGSDDGRMFSGIRVFAPEQALQEFAGAGVVALVCEGNVHLNQNRLAAYMAVKKQGYRIVGFASSSASVATDVKLRENVFVDDRARLLPRANIGANSWIMSGSEIGAGVRIGSSCWISSQCAIGDGAVLGKNCTLGRGVVIGPGVSLPAWSTINEPVTLNETPGTPLFIDARFRGRVTLHEGPG